MAGDINSENNGAALRGDNDYNRCKKEKAKVQPDYAMEEESWALEKGKCESLGANKEGTIEWGDEEMR
jgi:hypothetical protein